MEANYELCEKCEKAMADAGVFGLTVEEMFDQQATFKFDLALILMEEGHDLVRKSQKEEIGSIRRLILKDTNCDGEQEYQFAGVHEDKVVFYVSFTTEDILADDWTVAKLAE